MDKKFPPQKDFFVTMAAGIFVGAVLFEIIPEVAKEISLFQSLIFLGLGVFIWSVLKAVTDLISKSGLAIVSSLAFIFHSFLEGSVTALSFSIDSRIGLIVAAGMFLHLLPEFFAIVNILQGEGVSLKKSVWVDIAGVITLIISFISIYLFLPSLDKQILSSLEAISGGAFLYIGIISFLKRAKSIWNVTGFISGTGISVLWRIVFKL